MQVHATPLPGVVVLEHRVFHDDRGFFVETYNEERFRANGLPVRFRQDNHSRSTRDVIRGLHYQLRHPQGKLVSVARGRIFDVAVDIRVGSPTFGRWHGEVLDADTPRSLWIPEGFAHGFAVLSAVADVVYKCSEIYHGGDDHGVLWSDAAIGIEWPVEAPQLSDKDRAYAGLGADRDDLPRYAA